MAEIKTGLGWSEAQWERVNSAVTEAFGKASVAGAFLPCYGPLPEAAEFVRDETLTDTGGKVTVADNTTLKLFNLTVKVELSSEQVAEDGLSSAVLAFRRAANTLAQVEDDLVFNGFDETAAEAARKADPEKLKKAREDAQENAQKARKARTPDLADLERALQKAESNEKLKRTARIVVAHPDVPNSLAKVDLATKRLVVELKAGGTDVGEVLVAAVVRAIAALEDDSHPGPFACVLGSNLFEEAHRPREKSMVLPADTITPLLNGPLLRSGQIDKDTGIVVSLAASEIDIVVATPPRAQFLQLTSEAKYLFRVYEKFVLRIKDTTAVHRLQLL